MRPSLLLSISVSLLLGCRSVVKYRHDTARSLFIEGTDALKLAYRQSLSIRIQSATRGEIFLLDFQTQSEKGNVITDALFPDSDLFPIRPYAVATRILDRRKLSESELAQVLTVLPKTIADENREGSFCHYPIHGIRLYDGDTLLFETSVCYECRNFYVSFPDGQSSWVGLRGGELQSVFKRVMPIPKSESQRFHALHATNPTKKR
jgi:hypothetical protein